MRCCGAPGGNCSDVAAVFASTNKYRSWHQAGSLTWSVPLAQASQAYALQLAKDGCSFEHSMGRDYGESIMQVGKKPEGGGVEL